MDKAISSSAPTDKRASYHHGDLRAHLIETVRHLVEEKGIDGFSISEASRLAGVSSAAPYKHFADKMEIVRAVVLEGMRRLGTQMDEAANAAPPKPLARLNAIGAAYIHFAEAEQGVFRLMFGLTESHGKNPDIAAAGEETFGIVIREVTAAMPEGADPEEIRRRAFMLWTFVHGHAFLKIDGKLDTDHLPLPKGDLLAEATRRVMV